MKIFVRAHPKARKAKIIRKDEAHFEIWVSEAPEGGKANRAILEALSEELGVAKSRLSLASGETSRNKTILVQ